MEQPKQQRRYEAAQRRIAKQKELIVETLRDTGNIEAACRKVGISRNTYYVWTRSDDRFRKESEEALVVGTETVCDTLESRLVARANSGDLGALKYFLGNKHPHYSIRASSRKLEREAKREIEAVEKSEHEIQRIAYMLQYLEPCDDPSHERRPALPSPVDPNRSTNSTREFDDSDNNEGDI